MGRISDDYANPEMLFAAGYSACFDSALNLVIKKSLKTEETSVHVKKSIGQNENGGFGLAPALTVNISNVPLAQAQELATQAHKACPYSNATRHNMELTLSVTTNRINE